MFLCSIHDCLRSGWLARFVRSGRVVKPISFSLWSALSSFNEIYKGFRTPEFLSWAGKQLIMSSIRSVERALLLLRVMNERAVWSLKDLSACTGLPKSSIHRLLETLKKQHYVWNCEGMYGYYQLTDEVHELSKGATYKNRLVGIAAPVLIGTTKRIRWPLSLAVVDGCQLRVNFCT